MADLDDFFAKKDRKKSKSVKKFNTADESAKKLDDPKQKPEPKPKKERPPQDGEEGTRPGEEEEWKEYEETIKDYTGLKIQVLQAGNGASGGNTSDGGSNDEGVQDPSKTKGPWNKPSEQAAEAEAPKPEPEPKPKEEPKKATAYVPPVARRLQQTPVSRRQQNRHAPDIHNDDYFPVLGASGKRPTGGGWSTAGASAQGGAGSRPQTRQPLALDNRFTSLQDDS